MRRPDPTTNLTIAHNHMCNTCIPYASKLTQDITYHGNAAVIPQYLTRKQKTYETTLRRLTVPGLNLVRSLSVSSGMSSDSFSSLEVGIRDFQHEFHQRIVQPHRKTENVGRSVGQSKQRTALDISIVSSKHVHTQTNKKGLLS